MKGLRLTALGVAVGVWAFGLAAGGAVAQIGDSNAPVDITADSAEVINAQCLAIWNGRAEATQGQMRLRAERIKVYTVRRGNSCGRTDRIVAEGGVYYVTPTQTARGDNAVYSQSADTIVITGNVVIVQGRNVARGDRLTIHVPTRQAVMDSNSRGRGGNRVRGVFYPGSGAPTLTGR